jgi:hypothetical protein
MPARRGGARPVPRGLDVPADPAWRVDALARLFDLDPTEVAELAIGALRNGEKSDVPDLRRGLRAGPAFVRAGQDAQTSRQREERRGDRDAAGNTQPCGPPNGNLERTLWLLEWRGANEVGERTHVLCEPGALPAAPKMRGEKDALQLRELAVDLVRDPRARPCAIGLVRQKPAHLPTWT